MSPPGLRYTVTIVKRKVKKVKEMAIREEILYYKNQIRGLMIPRAAYYLKHEFEEGRLSRPAYDYLERNLEDIV